MIIELATATAPIVDICKIGFFSSFCWPHDGFSVERNGNEDNTYEEEHNGDNYRHSENTWGRLIGTEEEYTWIYLFSCVADVE